MKQRSTFHTIVKLIFPIVINSDKNIGNFCFSGRADCRARKVWIIKSLTKVSDLHCE